MKVCVRDSRLASPRCSNSHDKVLRDGSAPTQQPASPRPDVTGRRRAPATRPDVLRVSAFSEQHCSLCGTFWPRVDSGGCTPCCGEVTTRRGVPRELSARALRRAFATDSEDHAASSIARAWAARNQFLRFLILEELEAQGAEGGSERLLKFCGRRRTPCPTRRGAILAFAATALLAGIRLSELLGLDLGSIEGRDACSQASRGRGDGPVRGDSPACDRVRRDRRHLCRGPRKTRGNLSHASGVGGSGPNRGSRARSQARRDLSARTPGRMRAENSAER